MILKCLPLWIHTAAAIIEVRYLRLDALPRSGKGGNGRTSQAVCFVAEVTLGFKPGRYSAHNAADRTQMLLRYSRR